MRTEFNSPLTGTGQAPGQRKRMAATATVLTAACLVAIAAVAGCSNDDNSAQARSRRTTTTSERETTTTTLSPEEAEKQAVIAAHDAAIQAIIDSSAPPSPDPDSPALAATHTDYMLEYAMSGIRGMRANGAALRFPEGSQRRSEVDSIRFEDVDGQRVAFLEVCTVDDAELFIVESGEVVSGGVRTIQTTEAMKNVDGVWKLAEQRPNVELEGVTGCAAD